MWTIGILLLRPSRRLALIGINRGNQRIEILLYIGVAVGIVAAICCRTLAAAFGRWQSVPGTSEVSRLRWP